MNASLLHMSMLGISLYCMNLDLYMLFGRVLQYFFINCYAVPRVGASLISFGAWFHNFSASLTKLSSLLMFLGLSVVRLSPPFSCLLSLSGILVFVGLPCLLEFDLCHGLGMDRRSSLSSMSCMFLLSFSLLPSSRLRTLFVQSVLPLYSSFS